MLLWLLLLLLLLLLYERCVVGGFHSGVLGDFPAFLGRVVRGGEGGVLAYGVVGVGGVEEGEVDDGHGRLQKSALGRVCRAPSRQMTPPDTIRNWEVVPDVGGHGEGGDGVGEGIAGDGNGLLDRVVALKKRVLGGFDRQFRCRPIEKNSGGTTPGHHVKIGGFPRFCFF